MTTPEDPEVPHTNGRNGVNGKHLSSVARTPPVHMLVDPSWERQPGEGATAFRAFAAYRDMPRPRSIPVAYRQVTGRTPPRHGQVPGHWRVWESEWRWTDRCRAWDQHLDEQQRHVIEEANRAEAVRIAGLRAAQRQQELDLGQQLLERARQMLQFPILESTTELGQNEQGATITQNVKPTKWRLADVASIARVGVELRRLGLDMETSRASVKIDIEAEVRALARQYGWDEQTAIDLALNFANERGERAG